jgi:hypothetical protein
MRGAGSPLNTQLAGSAVVLLTAPTLGEAQKGLMSGVDFAGWHSGGRMLVSGLWRWLQ